MKTIDRKATLLKLKSDQKNIEYESDEDEGAMEFFAELQSVIDVIERGSDDHKIREVADWVGVVVVEAV